MDFSFPEYHPREAARQKGAGRLWVPPDSSWRTIAHLERPAWISRCRHQLICPRAIPSDSRTTLVACKHSSYKSEIDLSSPPTPSLLTVIDTIQKATLPCLLITSERTEGRCQDENGSGSWKPKTRLEVTVAISLLEKREKKRHGLVCTQCNLFRKLKTKHWANEFEPWVENPEHHGKGAPLGLIIWRDQHGREQLFHNSYFRELCLPGWYRQAFDSYLHLCAVSASDALSCNSINVP